MSAALDSLLAELTPPPVPAGLAERISAAIQSVPQEPSAHRARRAAGRDRRGRWRRGLVVGAASLGLAVSSAVAASLAGVPLPSKVEAVIAKLPLIGKEKRQATAPPPRARPAERAAVTVTAPPEVIAKPPAMDPFRMHEIRQLQRLAAARQIVEARRAAGLPTPRADRIERRLERRAETWRQASPEQRAQWLERRRQRQETRRAIFEARRAALAPPPPLAARPEPGPPRASIQLPPRGAGPVYGPVDPRVVRAPADDGPRYRLPAARAQRLEQLRRQRMERQDVPATTARPPTVRPAPATRPAPPARRPAPPPRSEGLRPPTR